LFAAPVGENLMVHVHAVIVRRFGLARNPLQIPADIAAARYSL
jgi:hypothetical protein